ncbi:asparagine-rich protein [Polyergus mexicanus]|uniref:asparagine-rich protein n=1 Tax=Polyergus mexicanus TaxID=615972 RepID=UPI0038B6413C
MLFRAISRVRSKMDSQTNKEITWSLLELTGLLEEEDAHVHFERTTKHLALHPYHLINIQRSLNQILKSSLNNYDKELDGFMLAFKNPKLLSNFGELLYDSPFIHVDIEADFYLFRPMVGSFLKGIVNKKGLDHIVVLVHKIYTISIPKPDSMEEWLGDSVEIGQEIRCCINQVDNKSKPPFICATLNSDYLQGCRLSESINVYNMENVIENDNLDSTIKLEKTNSEISEDDNISAKEKKCGKKHKKSCEINTFKNTKYEDNNTDSTTERHDMNSTDSINEDDTVSNKEKKKHRKKHKRFNEIASESCFKDQTKTESSNNTGNDIYRYIKCEINDDTDSIIGSQNLNNTIKIDTSTNQILKSDTISEKEKRKYRRKHKKSSESDLESTSEDKNKSKLNNNTESDIYINIKCENNIHNSVIESHNLDSSIIKIDSSMNGILKDDAFSDKEKQKFRKKHKKYHEIDPESISENKNETKLNNNADSNIHKNIKCEDNIHNSTIESHNLDNNTIKITSLMNGILEDDTFSDKEKQKFRKKHKKYHEIDPESISEDKNATKLNNNIDSNIRKNIKCEDNIHNTNSAIKNYNSDRGIKIEKLIDEISEDGTSNRERTKHRKKRKESPEIDTASDYLESYKKKKKTSIFSDSESKTHIKIKAEKFDSDVEFKIPIKIKVEKV